MECLLRDNETLRSHLFYLLLAFDNGRYAKKNLMDVNWSEVARERYLKPEALSNYFAGSYADFLKERQTKRGHRGYLTQREVIGLCQWLGVKITLDIRPVGM